LRKARLDTAHVESLVPETEKTHDVDNTASANNDSLNDGEIPPADVKPKKRKRKDREEEAKADDLETRYINKVYDKIKKQKMEKAQESPIAAQLEPADSLPNAEPADNDEDIDLDLLQHETVTSSSTAADKTIFISNLPVKVLTSKSHLRSLRELFSLQGRIESIRFRSIAFTDLLPRKVAFITKKLHPERDTLNAYIVYHEANCVDEAVNKLNGFLWEGKHLRVDSVANPTVSLSLANPGA
jgi:nucleolar protein 12